ncbi:hypothetical protein JW916_11980 [Candidatus Sumerlaeota bacterium]|nr:hypothetical protein [Candidatus Sumerlaeota bacterium]
MRESVRIRHVFEATIVAVVAGYAVLLIGFPDVFRLWFFSSHFHYQNKDLFSPATASRFVALGLSCALLAFSIRWARRRRRIQVFLLFASGVALQWSFSFLDGGVNAARLTATLINGRFGHSEFPLVALREEHPLALARDYESIMVKVGDLRSFVKSKPPGHLLFYVLWAEAFRVFRIDALFERLSGPLRFSERGPFTAYGGFLAVAFSLVSNLPVFVLWKIGTLLGNRRVGLCCCVAFLLCPSIQLVTMHLDQVLYPLLVSLTILFALWSVFRNRYYALLAALVLYVSIYTSFSLLFLIPAIGLLAGAFFLPREDLRTKVLDALLIGIVGVLISYLLFHFLLNFSPIAAYRRSMTNHLATRGTPGLVDALHTLRNLGEFARWIGLPAAVAYVWCCCGALRRWWRSRRISPLGLFALGYPFLVAAVSTLGHTVAEVGRLWIPLMIPMFVPVASELATMDRRRAPWVYVVSCLVAILLAKNFHDF